MAERGTEGILYGIDRYSSYIYKRPKEEENAKPQPTEITIIEKRSLRTKILLGTGIVVLAVALVSSLIYIGLELYNYFA